MRSKVRRNGGDGDVFVLGGDLTGEVVAALLRTVRHLDGIVDVNSHWNDP
jgi:hypothetical protein